MEAKQSTDEGAIDEKQRLGLNLTYLLKEHQLTIQQLAGELNMPSMTIRRLITSTCVNPTLATLKLIADRFKVSIDDLTRRAITGAMRQAEEAPIKLAFVPVIDWQHVLQHVNDLSFTSGNDAAWQQLPISADKINPNCFALPSRPSMNAKFPRDTFFIIDPKQPASDGDTVLVYLRDEHELTLRNLKVDPPDWMLHSMIFDSKTLKYDEAAHQILGAVVMTITYYKNTG